MYDPCTGTKGGMGGECWREWGNWAEDTKGRKMGQT